MNGLTEGAAQHMDSGIVLAQSLYHKIEATEQEFVNFINMA